METTPLQFIRPLLDRQAQQDELMYILAMRFEETGDMLKAARLRRILNAIVKDILGSEFSQLAPKTLDKPPQDDV